MLHALTAIAGGIELLTDLTLASVVLMALGRIADAIRLTYRAGRFCGWAWFRYGLPALLWTADGISWLNAQIDWRFVADTVVDCFKVIVSLLAAAYLTIKPHAISLLRASRKEIVVAVFALVYWVSCTLAPASSVLTVPKRV